MVFFAIVYASIGALQVYESIVILTQGGPGDATRSLSILIVEEGFGSFQIGYAASISVVMTVIILIITAHPAIAVAPLGAAMSAASAVRPAPPSAGSTAAIIAVMVVLAIGMLLPFLWLFSMSFRPVSDAYKLPPSFLPPNLDFTNYAAVLASRVPFLQIYCNSRADRRRGDRSASSSPARSPPSPLPGSISAAATRCSSSCWSG